MDYPITDQPTSGFGMPKQGGNLEGLERLAQLRELTVKQRHPGCLELMECWEYQNKYDVADENGEQTFFLKEESSCLMRSCCANARELEVSMQDMNGKELLRFDRPLKCMECPCDGCYPNWTQVLSVYHQGDLLGRIREVPVFCTRKHLEVWDSNEQKLYDITGPCCPIGCGTDVPFQIENAGGITVGEIKKKWRGCFAESFTDTDTFKIEFPDNIDVATKALLMGATMLWITCILRRKTTITIIEKDFKDYMYFEKKNDNKNNN